MSIPRVLIIDDAYGRTMHGRNRDRENFCFRLGMADVTGDTTPEQIREPLAEAVFWSGQIEEAGCVENDLASTLQTIKAGWACWPRWALILLDLHFKTGLVGQNGLPMGREEDAIPDRYFGLSVLEGLRLDPALKGIPVIILSSMERNRIERRFSDLQALDFFDKTHLNREKVKLILDRYALLEDAENQIVGRSIPLLKCLREARNRALRGDDNILILGESGTGKELIAHYIHRLSPRRNGPYVECFVHGVPETLIEQKLFGYARGAFTGAERDRVGDAEQANHGTLFIDEFGDIPPNIQTKFLRLLDRNTRESQRIGSNDARRLDLQIVMATNRFDVLSGGDFRHDILSRVKVTDAIVLPPLRDRLDDLPLLVEYFVRKYEQLCGGQRREIPEEALEILKTYSWPLNVRELEQTIESAVRRFSGLKYLSKSHISFGPERILPLPRTHSASSRNHADEHGRAFAIEARTGDQVESDINRLIDHLDAFTFDANKPSQLVGGLPRLEEAFARLFARYLKAGIEATRKPTPGRPAGDIFYSPALRLLTGDSKLTPTNAKRLILKYTKTSPENLTLILSDPLLREMYEIAKGGRSKKEEPDQSELEV